ncbi:MAG: type II toxin-antitoxin system RelE/ParE family toxin [Faecalibacterium sp.]|nr:type II toxin-antitoxin system RelE/ParE family toxin [Ruminococcus sp.]MCM1391705.1 type II toxin-antitoxin system RelE/ParE family toxin [Ruminococcus sp.]MCM1486133.1 type II toxin-antitoxin system RelE/ParE family toxin [Faecalibacterium sp.]
MKYSVVISPKAADDLKGIYEYIAFSLCEEKTAKDMLLLLEENIFSLDEMPGRYRVYDAEPWKTRNLHIMPVKNYLVFYIPDEQSKTVNIVRVIYGSRNLNEQLEK